MFRNKMSWEDWKARMWGKLGFSEIYRTTPARRSRRKAQRLARRITRMNRK